jgi:hypothetical protein
MNSVCEEPPHEAQPREDLSVHLVQRPRVVGARRQDARREDVPAMRHVERRLAVAARALKEDLPVSHEGVDVEDLAGDVAFEQEASALVAELVEDRVQIFFRVGALDADRAGARARLDHPRCRHPLDELGDLRVVQEVHELGDADPEGLSTDAHGELVTEIAGGGLAHARDAQVLAQHGRDLEVEVVEGDDAVEDARARQVADGAQRPRPGPTSCRRHACRTARRSPRLGSGARA